MTMLELRLLIFFIGLIVLALIYYFGRKPKITKPTYQEDELFQIEPSLNQDSNLAVSDTVAHNRSADDNPQAIANQPQLVSLFIHAKDGLQFDWHQIKDAAAKAGLEYGSNNLFYRYRRIGDNKETLFLVANMLKPGTFDVDMRTTGLAFVMKLPGTMSALDMWDTLFPVANRMAELLGGHLTDESHSAFSRQRIASMREEMRLFDQQHSH